MNLLTFEELEVWQKSRILTKMVFDKCEVTSKKFPYSLTDQILRASISVMSNIAEGFGAGSDKNFIKYLNISIGSLNEVKSLLYVFVDQKYFTEQEFNEIYKLAKEINKMLFGLKKYLTTETQRHD